MSEDTEIAEYVTQAIEEAHGLKYAYEQTKQDLLHVLKLRYPDAEALNLKASINKAFQIVFQGI